MFVVVMHVGTDCDAMQCNAAQCGAMQCNVVVMFTLCYLWYVRLCKYVTECTVMWWNAIPGNVM